MSLGRILFDMTYTRTQKRAVGITRTVSRLAGELATLAPVDSLSFAAVAFDGEGFCEVDRLLPFPQAETKHGRLLGWATGFAKPAIERALQLPWPMVRPLWEVASAQAFRGEAARMTPVRVGPEDVILLFDASWNYPVWRAARQARRLGAAVVPLIHDLMPLTAPQFCLPWVRAAFGHWLQHMLACSSAILCNSAATENELRAYASHKGWTLPPTAHFHLGSDPFRGSSQDVRPSLRQLANGHAGFYATVGSVEPKKNHGVLLDAFEQLWVRGQMLPLVVAGRQTPDGANTARCMEALVAKGRPLHVVPDANDAEIAFLYRHARALVLPSLFEGFGLPLVEARAQGCQVLASSIPSFRELADAGVHLFDPRQPQDLTRLVAAHAQGELVLAGSSLHQFGWQDSARQCLSQIRMLLSCQARTA